MKHQSAQAVERRMLEALAASRIRHLHVLRRGSERDTRLDVDAAGTKLDRHHRSETRAS
ncbi:MAG: hypothetical protein M3P41_13770 [Actinomycetota bacterium]|nr:hypothetical protein [Actinomycetota bacterium]